MTADFSVRQARPADAPSLARLRWMFKQEDEVLPEAPDVAEFLHQTEAWLADRLADGRWSAWVAETAEGICGHVFLQPVERMPDPSGDSAPIGYVTNFYVTPGHRDRGIGSALLRAVADHGRAAAFDTLIVWPSERSAALYRRAGFRTPNELLELSLGL